MGLSDMVDKAKAMFTNRGGADALKEDATEVKEDLGQQGSATDKAKDVAQDLKDPGAPGP
ncbi:MAG TPA: hypothetical protein VGF25_12575 [Thermoleophilaceae bacterium]|jgi:hypothetical protein